MAPPSRAWVGVTVFGLMASMLTVPYTAVVLSGYNPAALSPYLGFDAADDAASKVFLVIASLLSVVLTWYAWRNLVTGARADRRRREARRQVVKEQRSYKQRPPGPN